MFKTLQAMNTHTKSSFLFHFSTSHSAKVVYYPVLHVQIQNKEPCAHATCVFGVSGDEQAVSTPSRWENVLSNRILQRQGRQEGLRPTECKERERIEMSDTFIYIFIKTCMRIFDMHNCICGSTVCVMCVQSKYNIYASKWDRSTRCAQAK